MQGLLYEYVGLLLEGKTFDMEEFRNLRVEDAWEYIDLRCKMIGTGVGRDVFDTGLGYVIKMGKPLKNGLHPATSGRRQNSREANLGKCFSGAPVPKVYAHAANYQWIAVEKVKPVPWHMMNAAVKRMTVSSLKNALDLDEVIGLLNIVRYPRLYPKSAQDDYTKLYAENEWFASLVDLVKHCKLDPNDFHNNNWGKTDDGRLVLLDPGL